MGAVLKLTLMSGLDEEVCFFVTLITGEAAFFTFCAALFFAGAFLIEDFFGAAFFVAVFFVGAAFFAGADFFGADFFFCVVIPDIIATRTPSWWKSPGNAQSVIIIVLWNQLTTIILVKLR